jgi:toxin ParE1/3/4
MRPLYLILPAAQRDIEELTEYIARDNLATAIAFHQAIQETIKDLARMPGMGARARFRSPHGAGLRKWTMPAYRSYTIYYRRIDVGIEVIRVLHGSRDQPDALRG